MGVSCIDLQREEREKQVGRLIRRNEAEEDNFDDFEDTFVPTKHTEHADK